MKEKKQSPIESLQEREQQLQNMQASTGDKLPSSGITQPHLVKKQALGPNTNR